MADGSVGRRRETRPCWHACCTAGAERLTLNAVAQRHSPVGLLCPLVGSTRGIPSKHCARPPAGQAHEVALKATRRKPRMRERVTELMGAQTEDACLGSPIANSLINAACG